MFEDEMSEETVSADPEEALDEFEIDADGEPDESLDQAMREALDAVEQIASQADDALEAEEQDLTDAVDELAAREVADNEAVRDGTGDDEVAQLRAEISDLRDRSVRTLADFDNYRKRVEREHDDLRRYAAMDLLRDFVGVIDNLERAVGSEGSVEDLKQGVQMILRQMRELLRGQGVQQVEAEGARFDPAVHEAVSQVSSTDADAPMVDSVLQQGYVIHERLLRPAMVVVAMPATDAPGERDTEAALSESDGDPGEEGSGQ